MVKDERGGRVWKFQAKEIASEKTPEPGACSTLAENSKTPEKLG